VDEAKALRLFRLAVALGEERAAPEVKWLEGIGQKSVAMRAADASPPEGPCAEAPTGDASDAGTTRDESILQYYMMCGRAPEEFDVDTTASYRAYLAANGVTDEVLARRRRWADLERVSARRGARRSRSATTRAQKSAIAGARRGTTSRCIPSATA
jgi:hypothetical protein